MAFQSYRYNAYGSWTPAARHVSGVAAINAGRNLALIGRLIETARPVVAPISAANRTRRAVMREAWAIKREQPGAAFGDCLREAWAVIKSLGR